MRGASGRSRQRGVALLTAILIVALGTILAASLSYENVLTARRAQATFAFDQSLLIAEGGEALAAYALRATRQSSPQQVYPGQVWSMPYGPVEIVPEVTLQASLEDMSGRFNLNDLVDASGVINPATLGIFENLLENLGLEPKWAAQIADWIDADSVAYGPDGAEDATYLSQIPPYRTPNVQITSTSELLALAGFGRDRYLKLAPYVAALPQGTRINLCTASGPVLDALLGAGIRQFSSLSAQTFANNRAEGCWPRKSDFDASLNGNQQAQQAVDAWIAETSDYFRLTSIVSIGTTQFALYSLLHMENQGNGGLKVHTIQRAFTPD